VHNSLKFFNQNSCWIWLSDSYSERAKMGNWVLKHKIWGFHGSVDLLGITPSSLLKANQCCGATCHLHVSRVYSTDLFNSCFSIMRCFHRDGAISHITYLLDKLLQTPAGNLFLEESDSTNLYTLQLPICGEIYQRDTVLWSHNDEVYIICEKAPLYIVHQTTRFEVCHQCDDSYLVS
jgi:hypothetical protein